ncbi:MAG: tRNA (adenosine(37)-N6)-threonylcarbamoyltransferase complex dimerization subunit type 1 TsaB [Planctomycetota bacterium]|nr:tRNA (adenosine(37)-N6)-threonylcarbamoyltransferase complex dimerization subunit type 1 TsaB [Planctomycetota bacterium]
MPTLLLATSGPHAEVGLVDAEGVVRVSPLIEGRTRGRDVLPAIAALLEEAGVAGAALDAVAVDVGPGSFTGVRVGVTTAKTLAWSLDVPAVGILSLDVLAAAADTDGPILALRDAGRRRAYAARYEGGRRTSEPARLDPDALPALAAGATLVGEDIDALAARLELDGERREVRATAAALWTLTAPRLEAGETTPPHALAPRYLQASAPERLRDGEAPGDA